MAASVNAYAYLVLRRDYGWTPGEIAAMPDWFVELVLSKGGE